MPSTSDPSTTEPAVLAEDLWVKFLIRYHRTEITLRETFVRAFEKFGKSTRPDSRWQQEFWALKGVNIVARPGEVVGLIGRNGCGKTTLLKSLAGILGADRGQVTVRGKVSCLLSFGVGFNPMLSGHENIYLNGSILGLSRRMIDDRIEDIVAFSELGDFINAPVRTYSAGMKGRLGFSIAVHIDPDVLLLDEVLSVGDASFRRKAGSILDRYREENKTVVVASHSMDLIRKQCTRVYWIVGGRVFMEGDPEEVTQAYTRHAALEGVEADLTSDYAETEAEDAKAHWRSTKPEEPPHGDKLPRYVQTICESITATKPESVFDFGCKTGRNLKTLSSYLEQPAKLLGVDINGKSIQFGKKEFGLDLQTSDESCLAKFDDDSWDAVLTMSALANIPEISSIADELVRIAGKHLFIFEPYLPGREGRIQGVKISGESVKVLPYSYLHDYTRIFTERSLRLMYDICLSNSKSGIGALHRLMVFTKPGVAADCTAELGRM